MKGIANCLKLKNSNFLHFLITFESGFILIQTHDQWLNEFENIS